MYLLLLCVRHSLFLQTKERVKKIFSTARTPPAAIEVPVNKKEPISCFFQSYFPSLVTGKLIELLLETQELNSFAYYFFDLSQQSSEHYLASFVVQTFDVDTMTKLHFFLHNPTSSKVFVDTEESESVIYKPEKDGFSEERVVFRARTVVLDKMFAEKATDLLVRQFLSSLLLDDALKSVYSEFDNCFWTDGKGIIFRKKDNEQIDFKNSRIKYSSNNSLFFSNYFSEPPVPIRYVVRQQKCKIIFEQRNKKECLSLFDKKKKRLEVLVSYEKTNKDFANFVRS